MPAPPEPAAEEQPPRRPLVSSGGENEAEDKREALPAMPPVAAPPAAVAAPLPLVGGGGGEDETPSLQRHRPVHISASAPPLASSVPLPPPLGRQSAPRRPPPPPLRAEPVVRQASAMAALQRELREAQAELAEAICRVSLADFDLFEWDIEVAGPETTPYRGGRFRFLLQFPPDYPEKQPRVRCATPIFHCNIDVNGTVCLRLPEATGAAGAEGPGRPTALSWLKALLSLLAYPVLENALVPDAAALFLSNRPQHDHQAYEWTMQYAV